MCNITDLIISDMWKSTLLHCDIASEVLKKQTTPKITSVGNF